MSIIYDALKKIEQPNALNSKRGLDNLNKPKRKIYLLYILIALLGVSTAQMFLNLFTKSLNTNDVRYFRIFAKDASILDANATAPYYETRKETEPVLVLNGIFFSQEDGYALINNRVVKKGDLIEGATVKQINLDEVELEYKGSPLKLSSNK